MSRIETLSPDADRVLYSDADGTLVDTAGLIRRGQYEAVKLYLELCGIPADHIPSYEVYERHLNEVVGGSTRETFERTLNLLFQDQAHHLEGINFDELNASLNPIQDELAPQCVRPFPGVSDLLHWLGETDRAFAIFTSGSPHHVVRNFGIALPELESETLYRDVNRTDKEKLEIFIERMKAVYGIARLAIITCEDVTRTKPHPEGLILAARQLDVNLARGTVLGDHKVDMQTAFNAGVLQRIGITHGFDDRQILTEAGATNVVDSLSEVRAIMEAKNGN